MELDPAQASPRDIYRHMVACITPRPIAWVSTISPAGVANLAPFSFFNGVGANPPSIVFCPVNRRDGSPKDTLVNIRQTRQFAVNIVSHRMAELMNLTSAELDYEVSEFEHAGVRPAACRRIAPPRVAEAGVCLECELQTIIDVGSGPLAGHVVVGQIVMLHIDDGLLDGSLQIDAAKLDTIGRMGASLYARTTNLFEMARPDTPVPGRAPHSSQPRP